MIRCACLTTADHSILRRWWCFAVYRSILLLSLIFTIIKY